jgi:hypothetical protein
VLRAPAAVQKTHRDADRPPSYHGRTETCLSIFEMIKRLEQTYCGAILLGARRIRIALKHLERFILSVAITAPERKRPPS